VTAPTEERAPHSHAPAPSWFRAVRATPMSRARAGILLGLALMTVGSWWLVIDAPSGAHHSATPTMGLSAPLFLAVWVAMMIATMFPAVAPMVLMFARISATQRTAGKAFLPTWLFVAGYLVVWTGLGAVAYGLALGAQHLAGHVDAVDRNAARIGGGLIVVAGVHQFSTLKDRCLTECRSPMAFVMQPGMSGDAMPGMTMG